MVDQPSTVGKGTSSRKRFRGWCHVALFLTVPLPAHSLKPSPSICRSRLRIPSAGPSWEYLSPNRLVSTRLVDWCQGRMLPLQIYHSIRPRTSSSSSGYPFPSKEATTGSQGTNVVVGENDSQKFLDEILQNPENLDLSKTSQSMLQGLHSLTAIQRDNLAQKIRVEQQASQPVPKDALEIIYCDAHICVTNKPSGILSVPGPRRNPSLANLVYETLQPPGVDLDQMIVHRLDMATSGIIVYALSLEALSQLHLDFKERRVQKTYEALVCHENSSILSSPSSTAMEGEIDVDIERDPNNAPFMRIAQPKDDKEQERQGPSEMGLGQIGSTHKFYTQAPKESLTTWRLLRREIPLDGGGPPVSRLELRPWTGRTHQLRVHCAQALGAPIVGDDIYGPISTRTGSNTIPLCLHAKRLCIYHPISGAPMIFEADPPF